MLPLSYPKERLYYMDWLRVIAMAVVLFVHVTMPFQAVAGVWMIQFEDSLGAFYCAFYGYCTQDLAPVLVAYGCLVGHLWFLGLLLVYSFVCLPLLSWLKKPQGLRWVAKLARLCQNPMALLVFILPVAVIQAALKARFPEHQNWSDFLVWMVYFLTGFIFAMDRRFMEAVIQVRWIALGTGLVSFITIILLLLSGGRATTWELRPEFSWGYALYQVLRSLNSWAWVVFVLGTGATWLNANRRFLKYGSEAVLPVYILHHPVVVAVAFMILDWQTSIWIKLPVFVSCVVVVTLGVYELFIRRWNVTRFLFGMRLKT